MPTFYEGGLDTFNAFAHGETHPNTMRFLEDMISRPSTAVTEASRSFMEQSQNLYDQFMGSAAMRRVRAAGQQIASHWQQNVIQPVETVAGLQTAPVKMHRWLMAEPNIRHLYHNQQCDGYSGTYFDAEPGAIGEEHSDWRRVMDGIVRTDDDQYDFYAVEYLDDLGDDERDFLFEEQFDLLRSWHTMAEAVMAKKDDPTSRWNAEL